MYGLLAACGFAVVLCAIFFLNPSVSLWPVVALYFGLLVGITGLVYAVETLVRQKYASAPWPMVNKQARRHGLLVSLMAVSFLVLLSQGLLSWWLSASIVLLIVAVEAVFNL